MIPTTIAPHGIIGASGLPRNASLDIDAYFPVDPERRWGVISTRQRRNGETIVEDLHWKIHGQREVNGKNAWLLGDEKKLTIMISKDEDGIQHHGDLVPGEEDEVCTPPLTTISRNFVFRQPYSSAYIMEQGEKKTLGLFTHQMTGYETLKLPAGIFHDCLRTDTYFQRDNGPCFTAVHHYASGVGLVRYSFRQIDPVANVVVVVGTLELSSISSEGAA